jgi:pyruvyltransferase
VYVRKILFFLLFVSTTLSAAEEGIPLYFYREPTLVNFGDVLSYKLVERIVGAPVAIYKKKMGARKKLLAIGSILFFARDGDVIWGSGLHGKTPRKEQHQFQFLDVRAVRGPLTRQFLIDEFGITVPEIYGDPALLTPYFFPEYRKKENPSRDYLIIPHYRENHHFPKDRQGHVVYTTDAWNEVLAAIVDAQFVISSSLHGIVVAEAYGIPARLLRISEDEPFLKYQDYYFGTGRETFAFATSVEEALLMGGESPPQFNPEKLYSAFPFEFWPSAPFKQPSFKVFP